MKALEANIQDVPDKLTDDLIEKIIGIDFEGLTKHLVHLIGLDFALCLIRIVIGIELEIDHTHPRTTVFTRYPCTYMEFMQIHHFTNLRLAPSAGNKMKSSILVAKSVRMFDDFGNFNGWKTVRHGDMYMHNAYMNVIEKEKEYYSQLLAGGPIQA